MTCPELLVGLPYRTIPGLTSIRKQVSGVSRGGAPRHVEYPAIISQRFLDTKRMQVKTSSQHTTEHVIVCG